MKKRAIVTGGCGFIGSYVVRALQEQGYTPIVIDNLSKGIKENIDEEIEFHKVDIVDKERLEQIIEEGDIIIHLAAHTSVPESIENPLPYHETNIRGTYTLLEVARTKKASGIIFSSSAAVYGSQEGMMKETSPLLPESPYAVQKVIGEQLCKSYSELYGIPSVCLRYFNVYGKGNHEEGSYAPVTARFLKAKKDNKPLPIIGDGWQTRDFIHVRDVARANVASISLLNKNSHEVINVCSGGSFTIIDIATLIGGDLEFLPQRKEVRHSSGDNSLLQKKLSLKNIIRLNEGIKELL